MCDIIFKKVQGLAWKVNRTSAYAEAAVRRAFSQEISQNSQKTAVPKSLF